MHITFVKNLSTAGATTTEAIQFERQLRAIGLWPAVNRVQALSDAAAPHIIVRQDGREQHYKNLEDFLKSERPHEGLLPEAACW
ncbi:MAG: hypothetical protein AAF387_10935 [Pseudomonadota bacterium]